MSLSTAADMSADRRLLFALLPPQEARDAFHVASLGLRWRGELDGRATVARTYHFPILHLDEGLGPEDLRRVHLAAETVRVPSVRIVFDRAGSDPRDFRHGCLFTSRIPPEWGALRGQLVSALRQQGLTRVIGHVKPRVVVAERMSIRRPPSLVGPVHVEMSSFALIQMQSGKFGPYFQIRDRWPLVAVGAPPLLQSGVTLDGSAVLPMPNATAALRIEGDPRSSTG